MEQINPNKENNMEENQKESTNNLRVNENKSEKLTSVSIAPK